MSTSETDTGLQEPQEAAPESVDESTPRQIVLELDKFVVGQGKAKRAVAIALRNRWRRQQLEGALREEIRASRSSGGDS